uniref:Uncharacterized protein n=1 Tax=Anguilla anguilla TaxID=7936 RepID=A0A0E9UFM1_ANGAN
MQAVQSETECWVMGGAEMGCEMMYESNTHCTDIQASQKKHCIFLHAHHSLECTCNCTDRLKTLKG